MASSVSAAPGCATTTASGLKYVDYQAGKGDNSVSLSTYEATVLATAAGYANYQRSYVTPTPQGDSAMIGSGLGGK